MGPTKSSTPLTTLPGLKDWRGQQDSLLDHVVLRPYSPASHGCWASSPKSTGFGLLPQKIGEKVAQKKKLVAQDSKIGLRGALPISAMFVQFARGNISLSFAFLSDFGLED